MIYLAIISNHQQKIVHLAILGNHQEKKGGISSYTWQPSAKEKMVYLAILVNHQQKIEYILIENL